MMLPTVPTSLSSAAGTTGLATPVPPPPGQESSDSESDDSQVRRQFKVSTVEWAGKKFSVTGK